jgi:CubicO group peptidase (beta-lactamase class C family)
MAWSAPRLRAMHEVLAGHVARGVPPGLVTLVSRHGETHADVVGDLAVGGPPMRRDTIFRISSMTKPIIAAAALILVEECVLRLDDPVDELLPELAGRRVLTSPDAPLTDTVPADRPITLRDLLTFRMGFGYLDGDVPITAAAGERGVAPGPPAPTAKPGPDEYLRRLGELPLMYQPGTHWQYQTAAEVLGVLIARAVGTSLGTFLRDRLFGPLGMVDTGFAVPRAALDRFATSYVADPVTGELTVYDAPEDSQWLDPTFESGSDGLVSTVDDCAAFWLMMVNKGRHDDVRILSRPAVALMTTDHLTPAQKEITGAFAGTFDNQGWGFGLAVVTRRVGLSWVPGQIGWDGGLGTAAAANPAEDLVAILLTQVALFPREPDVYRDFWTTAYQAID